MFKKRLACFLATATLLFNMPAAAAGAYPDAASLASAGYIVINAQTGQVLIAGNENAKLFPASITKILTMAMAMEKCAGDQSIPVTVTDECVIRDYSLSHIALQTGETLTLEQLFYATQLMSANDAANTLAIYVGGSIEGFQALANEKAAQLGCTGTHFTNPSGLPDDEHYTTAADMAKIMQYALTVPGMQELLSATSYVIPATNLQEEERLLGTSNLMLVNSKYVYEGAIGGKTGWTDEAGHTLVTAVERGGQTLICVAMGGQHRYDEYKDSHLLLDYCFENFTALEVPAASAAGRTAGLLSDGRTVSTLTVSADARFNLSVPVGTSAADISVSYEVFSSYGLESAVRPSVSFTIGGADEAFCTLPLPYTTTDDEEPSVPATTQPVNTGTDDGNLQKYLKISVLLLCVASFAYAALDASAQRSTRRRRRRAQHAAARTKP